MGYRVASWSLMTFLHPSIPSSPAPFVFSLLIIYAWTWVTIQTSNILLLLALILPLFSQISDPQKGTLTDTACQSTFIHQIFKEHIVYARHSSRIWHKSSERNRQRWLPSQAWFSFTSYMPPLGFKKHSSNCFFFGPFKATMIFEHILVSSKPCVISEVIWKNFTLKKI